jgi:glutathione peroxidase
MKSAILQIMTLLAVFSGSPTSMAAEQSEFFALHAATLEGKVQALASYRGKVMLVTNTASQCGYTQQYKGLESLYQKYRDQGLLVLGFPSNDFGGQEPGTDKEIRFFCKSKYAVDFPMFAKGPVSGEKPQPVFAWLLKHSSSQEPVAWNFEKFLISRDGKILGRFKSEVTPDSQELVAAVEKALAASGRLEL